MRAAALAASTMVGLGALHRWAGNPRAGGAQPSGDALAVALFRAEIDRDPRAVGWRCRLAREQLALGQYSEAELTLSPVLREGSAPAPEAALLSLEIAAAAWRATPPGSLERGAAQARAVARLESLLLRDSSPDEREQLTRMAHELGRTDLAARADERAASRERDPQRAMALGFAALDAYQAADKGADALQLADTLVERFSGERALLERAQAIALAQNDRERARRFGARLLAIGAGDAVSLGRQLDLELAAGDLAGALDAVERVAALAQADPRPRLTAAKVAIWAGRPDRALRHWMWLARHGNSFDGISQGLLLAKSLRDEAAVAELLTLRSRRQPLSPDSLAELADALDSSGPAGSADLALQAYATSHAASPIAWETLAALQERRRDLSDALATRMEIERRFGSSLTNSVRLATLHWAIGRPDRALAELERWSDSAKPGESDYWALLADLAWSEEADGAARLAYRTLWDHGHIDAVGTERLLLLSRDAEHGGDAIRIGREGWLNFREPRLLLLAMEQAAQSGRWDDLEHLSQEAAGAGDAFATLPAYWMLRARLDERTGRIPQALAAYRRALAADPKSVAARSGIIWLLAAIHDRPALSECLVSWEADAWNEPGLWRAWAAGLEELGRPSEALAFYQREAESGAGDELTAQRSLALRRALVSPASTARPGAAAIGAEVGVEGIGNVLLQRQRAFVSTEIAGARLEGRVALIESVSNEAALRVPGAETRLTARALFSGLGGQNEATAGVSLRADGNLLEGGVARTQSLASLGEARLDASFNETADESLALRLAATRTRLGGTIAISEGQAYQRIVYDWKSWSTRAGTAIGKGGSANLEIGWRMQAADPEINVRLQGGYQRNRLRQGPLPAALAAVASNRSAILPDELAMLGVGAGMAGLPAGSVRFAADAWVGSVGPPIRSAFRVQAGVKFTPFKDGELALTAFAANDRWATGGNAGLSVSLTHRFGR
jgi:tetratricopeptide (TPR) repeat protein